MTEGMTMIERVARAVCDARALPGSKPRIVPSYVDRRVSRAALETAAQALRELGFHEAANRISSALSETSGGEG
jgi:hypothetical protein